MSRVTTLLNVSNGDHPIDKEKITEYLVEAKKLVEIMAAKVSAATTVVRKEEEAEKEAKRLLQVGRAD